MDTDLILELEFPARDEYIHLNHAGVSPWPGRTAAAIARFAEENYTQGAFQYERWLQTEADLKQQMCRLIKASSADDIAILKNTSEGLSMIARGLSWNAGDNIVTSNQEFPSNRIVWQSLATQGVELRQAALDSEQTPEDALFALVDERTRLITVSSVQFATGLRMDLALIGEFCRRRDILFCVDAIQSLGVLGFDLEASQADFVVADGHKWMMGPEGVALFYVRPALYDRLVLTQYGWHMVEQSGDYDRKDWTVARSARRFECGSPNMLGIHGLQASLSLLFEVGLEAVSRMTLDNSSYLIDLMDGHTESLELLSDRNPERRTGIVTFRHRKIAASQLYQMLRDQGVYCAMRGGGIRFSPHFYTRRSAIENALRIVLEAG